MNIKDYKFKVGDEVITTEGVRGKIIDICICEKCKERGFDELIWVDDDGEENYITSWDALHKFDEYYKIGDYRFGKVSKYDKERIINRIADHEKAIQKLETKLRVIEEIMELEKE